VRADPAAAPKYEIFMVTRRLIGPTILIAVMCGLWADYLLFYQSPWSVTRILGKILAIFSGIFTPFFDPKLYSWADEFLVPGVIISGIIVLLYVVVARAKAAMRNATPEPYESVVLPSVKPKTAPLSETHSGADTAIPELAPRLTKLGLVGRLAISFGALSLLFAGAVSVIVYTRMEAALAKEIKQQADVIALTLGEIARRKISAPALNEAIDELASDRTVAYVYIEDPSGQIVAHRPRELLIYLRRDFPRSAERALKGVELDYRGLPVYEIAVRVGDAKGGYAHLAIWRDQIQEETRRVVAPIAGSILLLLSGATALFAWVVGIFNRPFVQLVEVASRISKGELDLEIGAARANEVGDLARSFDRMRSQLGALLSRLEELSSTEERSKEKVG
jgi:HAMP domain-containing protein